jgi:hypothetical protein
MTLRFTMDEFRKIPYNDKLLFGVLIIIILVNSMIPRVKEGLGTPVTGVSVPILAYKNAANASVGAVNDEVLSIKGEFVTTTAVPATTGTISFAFPSGHFVPITAVPLPTSAITLTLMPGTGSSITTTLARAATVPNPIIFTLPATPAGMVPGKYTFTINSAVTGDALFKLSSTAAAIKPNGWQISTSADLTPGTASMPAIIEYTSGALATVTPSAAETSMTGRQKAIMANIVNLQNIEKQLFDSLTGETDPEKRRQLVIQINQIAKSRGDLYANMNDFAGAMMSATAERRVALQHHYGAAMVVENQMNTAKTMLDGLREDKSNKLRLVEINNYYGRKYEYQTDIMKIVVMACAPILVISVLMKKGIVPETISGGLIILIIVAGIVAVARKVFDLNRRNNLNFDQYDHDFDPNAVSISKTENTNLAELSKVSLYSSCIGPNCCDGTTTVWNSSNTLCQPNPCGKDEKWNSNINKCEPAFITA